jgi:RNA polymerase sigma-70 factor, ECF subfamily
MDNHAQRHYAHEDKVLGYYDEKEMQSFIEREKKFLWSRAMGLTHKPEDAEDLYQETLMKIYQGWKSFDPETNFRAWAGRIMLNTHINNSTRRRESMSCDFSSGICDGVINASADRSDDELSFSDSPERIFFFHHIDKTVQEAFYSLPDSFRIPFALFHFEGYLYEDISKMLSLPIGTVKSRIFRARRMLRDKLQEKALTN